MLEIKIYRKSKLKSNNIDVTFAGLMKAFEKCLYCLWLHISFKRNGQLQAIYHEKSLFKTIVFSVLECFCYAICLFNYITQIVNNTAVVVMTTKLKLLFYILLQQKILGHGELFLGRLFLYSTLLHRPLTTSLFNML